MDVERQKQIGSWRATSIRAAKKGRRALLPVRKIYNVRKPKRVKLDGYSGPLGEVIQDPVLAPRAGYPDYIVYAMFDAQEVLDYCKKESR